NTTPESTIEGARRRTRRNLMGWQRVEPFRVAIAHSVFVSLGEPFVLVELFELGLAGFVIDLMGKVRGEDERFVADHAYGEGQGELVAFDAEVDAAFVDVTLDVAGDRFIFAQFQEWAARIVLHVAVPRALEAFDAADEPAGTGFHKTETHMGIFVENAVE